MRTVRSCHQALNRGSRDHEPGRPGAPGTPELSSLLGPAFMVLFQEALPGHSVTVP